MALFYYVRVLVLDQLRGHGADPSELLVSTQSATEVKQVADQVLALAASRGPGKPQLTVTVDEAEGATFPYAWYWRHLPVGYIDESLTNAPPPTTDVVTLDRRGQDPPAGRPRRLRRPPVPVPHLVGAGLRSGARRPGGTGWSHRKVWNPTGGMPEWLYVKKGV